jgi:hypothetical protein
VKQLVWLARGMAVLLLALHLSAPYLPEAQSWGIFPYAALPRALQVAGALLALALCIGPVNAGARRVLGWLARRWPAAWPRPVGYALFSLALAPLFWAGRIVHTRWGDAYILVNAIPHPDVRLTYSWQAPFDLLIHAKVWALAHMWWGWDAMRVYHVISLAAGVIFVFLLLCMADDLGRTPAERAAIAGLIGTLGLMQFYFGYIENYVLMTIGILGYLWLGLRYAERRAGLAAPAAALALTNAFHPSTILGLELSLAWLWLHEVLQAGGGPAAWRRRLAATLKVALPLLAVFGTVLLVMTLGGHGLSALFGADFPGGGDRRWFVPLSALHSKWEHYTMFSWAHLLDILNEQALVAPFSLALVIASLAGRRGRAALRSPQGAFLGVAAAGYLLLILTWNPDYGGRRDWDLFAPAALPLTLLAGYLLIQQARQEEHGQRRLAEIALIVAGVSALFTAAWVYSNTIPWSWG